MGTSCVTVGCSEVLRASHIAWTGGGHIELCFRHYHALKAVREEIDRALRVIEAIARGPKSVQKMLTEELGNLAALRRRERDLRGLKPGEPG